MFHLLLAVIYVAFISLGLPDGLLGAAWPTMYPELGVHVSYAGVISMIICMGTVVSSLLSDRLTRWLGTAKITAISVAMTAAALLGFSAARSFPVLCLWAIPYGLGAGSVDASLNNYVALHYSSRHMSWLHCMWGVGASTGPYLVGALLSRGVHWSASYLWIGIGQVVLSAVLLLSLPLWKKAPGAEVREATPLKTVFTIPGAKEVMLAFFCYCALEQTAALWSASYLKLHIGFSSQTAASLGSLFFLGMTAGRALSGFLAGRFRDTALIRLGTGTVTLGVICLLLPMGAAGAIAGLALIGLGCAPIYPCVIHATPEHFGARRSQALIGVQMASAYVGTALMPPLFGVITRSFGIHWMGVYLLVLLCVMALSHERLVHLCEKNSRTS